MPWLFCAVTDHPDQDGGTVTNHNRLDAHAALAEAREAVHRPDFRRAAMAGVIALAAPGVYYAFGGLPAHDGGRRIIVYAAIFACLVFGLIAVRSAANEAGRMGRARGGAAGANVLRWGITLAGYLIVVIEVLTLLNLPALHQLLLSGAITGVIVGIAAQQSLGNAFAGLVLLFSRPFRVGDTITLRSGALGGQYDGEVTAITLMYTQVRTEDGPISLPNSGVLAAAAGPRPACTTGGDKPSPATEPLPEFTPVRKPALGPRRRPRRGLRAVPAPALARRRWTR
jgi:Mechanosensitive ion channel